MIAEKRKLIKWTDTLDPKQNVNVNEEEYTLFVKAFENNNEQNNCKEKSIDIKFIEKVTAVDIAPYKYRYRIEFKVLK